MMTQLAGFTDNSREIVLSKVVHDLGRTKDIMIQDT